MPATQLLCLAAILTSLPVAQQTTIQVSSSTGREQSLQHYLCSGGNSSSTSTSSSSTVSEEVVSGTTLLLSPGQHSLQQDSSCVVADLSDLVIRGSGAASIVCSSHLTTGSNLIFLNITNLTLENVLIENCGCVLPPDLPPYINNTFTFIHTKQRVVVLLSHVTDLRLIDFTVTLSFGFSLIGINLKGDAMLHNVTLSNTDNFRHPTCHGNETDMSCSGSGAVLIYSDPLDEDNFILTNTSLTVTESTFANNENRVPIVQFTPVFLSIRGSFTLDRLLLTGASGLGVYFGQRTYDVDVSILSTTVSNNRGYASGVAFLLLNTMQNLHVLMDDCRLEGNEGSELARGGGVVMLVVSYISELRRFTQSLPGTHQLLTVTNTSFIGNYADIGGAAYFYISPQNISDYSITFDNVTFEENFARVGTVLEADTRPATFVSKTLQILMQDVRAINNRIPNTVTMSSVAAASENSAAFVFLSVFNITVSGRDDTHGSQFVSNSPGAFLVVGGNIYLNGNVLFERNSALAGGAISLYDFSLLFIVEGSRIVFMQNEALTVGGAIFASSPGTRTSPTCVFQVIGPRRVSLSEVHVLDLRMKFIGNSALEGGNSIYVNPLFGCATIPESALVDISVSFNTRLFYEAIFEFFSPVNNSFSEFASIPERICFCESDDVENVRALCAPKVRDITVVSGQTFSLGLFPTDLSLNPVSSILFIDVDSSAHSLGRGQTSSQLKGGKCTIVDLNLHGPSNTTVRLTLHTQQGTLPVKLNVRIEDCPPGFVAVERDHLLTCICDPYVTDVIGSTCNFNTYTILRPSNANATWLGVVEHEDFSDVVFVHTCPIGFCNRSLGSVDLTVPDYLCKEGRTGTLCGDCKGNLSVVFGSPECRECSNFWLFTIFLYAVAGVLLVIFLFLLNFTVAQGTISAISVIFYVNIVSVNSSLFFPASNRGFLFIWVSILNLELGFPLCFYEGMTEVAKAGLQCVFPIYLLLLCVLLIFFSRWFKSIAKLTSFHGIQVLATLIYLSYSKLLRLVIDIFSLSTLRSEKENNFVWLYDGNIAFFTNLHIIIIIFPAVVTLVFIVLYTLLLVFIKQVEQFTSKFKPLLDAYGGPFKDPFRFWFGMRLLLLTAMCLTYAIVGSDNPVLAVLVQQILLVMFMVVQAYLQPFRSQRMNALDLFFMLDLFSIFLYMVRVFEVSVDEQTRVVNALVSLAFILFLLLIGYHIYRIPQIYSRVSPKAQKLKDPAWWSSTFCRRCRKTPENGEPQSGTMLKSVKSFDGNGGGGVGISSTMVTLETSLDADKVITRGKENTNIYTQYRESLMDDMRDDDY